MRKPVTSAKKNKKAKKPKKTYTSGQLVTMGDAAMEKSDVPLALQHYQEAVTLLQDESTVTKQSDLLSSVLLKLGETKVAMGEVDAARDDFEAAIDAASSPQEKATLYLYLGQVSLEEDALDAYQKGIAELQEAIRIKKEDDEGDAEMGEQDDADDNQESNDDTTNNKPVVSLLELQHQLVRAHCTVAELYLTDLCFCDGAEQQCEHHVEQAMQLTTPPLPDALQVLVSLRLSQQKSDEAVGNILQVYASMKEGCEALATLVGLNAVEEEEAAELQNVEAANNLPGFEFRCQTAKLLLECCASSEESNTTDGKDAMNNTQQKEECIQAAIQVLGSLLAENDEVIEIYYLLGCAFELVTQSDENDSKNDNLSVQYWEQAMTMLVKVQQGLKHELEEDEDDENVIGQLQECESQMQDIQNKLARFKEEATMES